jgi:hypothetical protein
MNREQMGSNWQQFISDVKDQWRWLTHTQMDIIGDNQNYFTGKHPKNSYITDPVEAEKRLSDWQKLQRDKMYSQNKDRV